jgi:hypothetical protein
MARFTPSGLAAFREAYRERLARIDDLRSEGLSWEDVRRELEPLDERLAGQNHVRWRNERWLAKKDASGSRAG